MRNTLAIAQRELSAYFRSPIAYVMIGFFAILSAISTACRSTTSCSRAREWA